MDYKEGGTYVPSTTQSPLVGKPTLGTPEETTKDGNVLEEKKRGRPKKTTAEENRDFHIKEDNSQKKWT